LPVKQNFIVFYESVVGMPRHVGRVEIDEIACSGRVGGALEVATAESHVLTQGAGAPFQLVKGGNVVI
jgi:hypothetical protein